MATAHASIRRPDRKERISVLLPLPLGGVYDYAVAPGAEFIPGDFVTVPLGRRHLTGVVWGAATYEVGDEKLKEIEGLLDLPRMPEDLRLLVDWVASYTLSPAGAVLRMAMSVPAALEPPRATTAYLPSPDAVPGKPDSGARITDARRRVLEALTGGPPRAAADTARASGVSPSVIRGMADAGLLQSVSVSQTYDRPQPDWQLPGPTLSTAQGEAAAALRRAVSVSVAALKSGEEGGFSVTLLDGVTGSGKTEVYFEAIAETLAAGRQALVLLPEIALTAQWLERFKARFGVVPLEWHSDIGAAARRLGWRAVISGQASVVVGARSSLFLPFASLGLIVVDEEHDASFKQEEGVIYNARDMAVVRGRVGAFPVVLSSATPSLETVTNVEAGRYQVLSLPERHAGASMPAITAIDMRGQKMGRQSWLSPALQEAIAATLEAEEQVMLFLNRRGYAPLTLCRHCGHRLQCPNCTAWLVEHKSRGRLECHHCGLSIRPPTDCPECEESDSLAACGPGVERLAEEVKPCFPDARVEIMASDTVNSPAEVASLVHRMQEREIDILIGTQIMAKGHHFPRLTLVGVIDADLGLAGGDLRAAERTFQLLHQVSGRAGRAEHPGSVILQTYEPEHPVLEALVSGGRDRFLAAEAAERRRYHMPPFGRLVALIVSGVDRGAVEATARALARSRPAMDGVDVFGPTPAPMALLRGRHRWRLLLKARRGKNVQNIVRDWLTRVRIPSNVRVQIDVDPFSFL